jgi:hypothetical protein
MGNSCRRLVEITLHHSSESSKDTIFMLSSCHVDLHVRRRRHWTSKSAFHLWFIIPPKSSSGNSDVDLGYESLKTQSKIRISSFIHPSKIFVWHELPSLLRTQSSCYHHLVMSTDRSSWYHHPRLEVVSWTCTSSCDHHLVISRHAIIILTRSLWVVHTHRHAIIMRCLLTRQHVTAGSHARSLTRLARTLL